ncbi:MAG: nucleotide sugar dehydrogenase, partial [Desulfonatronovibrionaceae bacterium]
MFDLKIEDFLQGRDRIAVVGLGYVGLPLAVALSGRFSVLGYDISESRVDELRKGLDHTREVDEQALRGTECVFSSDPACLGQCGLVIVAVPTPIDQHRRPDLGPILSSCRTVGENMRRGCTVVFESTVYPGLTEEDCLPRLEEHSGLINGRDFWVGYSPERINPGDKKNTLQNIVKVVAGQEPGVTEFLAGIYAAVIPVGVHRAPNIRTAEAAKVIENTQRDLNIALMNELSLIFDQMGIDTREVLEAAGTKWNFLPFSPGLVGGHCIGVDPYYLTFKAEALGYHPQVILSGRRINDYMGKFVAERTVKEMIKRNCRISGSRVGVMGL